ncbi:MAG: crossover junction endodeoxyribonuclease RuvC [Candidatus Levybacteria bacterium]|nr:crossover junction endodeoxyribonuclease RuvC [Candidatus Levybacteria bacterium]
MIILGIDPGIGRMGWGIIQIQNSKFKIQNYGCVETKAGLPIEKRLKKIHGELIEIIRKHKPEVLAIEELFFGTNAKTAFVVGQARGVVLLTAAEKNIPVVTYTPLQVKIALTGYGRAEKAQIGQMVKVLLKLDTIPKPDDTADALAIALAHAFSRKMRVV